MRARFLSLLFTLFALPLPAAITGTVMTIDGAPVAGAKVSIHPLESIDARRARLASKTPERQPLAAAQTDSKGKYSFETPKDPVVELHVDAKGYAPFVRRAEREDDLGAEPLTKAESKTGTITANGKPVAGATVIWVGPGNGAEWITTTDANGKYSVPDPEKWNGRIAVLHPDFAPLTDALYIAAGKRDLNRTLTAGAPLSGKVVAEDGTTPVAKATVFIDGRALATTGDDGTFSIPHAPKWESIEVRSGDLSGLRANTSSKTDIRLGRGASLSGSIRDTKTQSPLGGTEVRLARGNRFDQIVVGSAITDAKGNFTLPAIAPGTYFVNAVRPGYSVLTSSVTLTAGQKVSKTLPATPVARVSGVVVDEDRKGIAAALLEQRQVSRDPMAMMMMGRMRGGGGESQAYSGPDGKFVAQVEPDADLQLDAVKRGLPTAKSTSFRLGPGERKSGIVITVPHGLALHGRVSDRNGKPLSGVGVTASESDNRGGGNFAVVRRIMIGGGQQAAEPVRTDSDGTFTMQLKEGTYDVSFQRDGFASKVVRGQQVTPSTPAVEVALDPGVAVAGRVTRGGNGIEGVNVNAFTPDRNANAVTGPDGTFRLDDLTPGSITINISKESTFIQQMRNVTAPAENVIFEIPPGGRISGRVVDKATHNPVTSFQAGISNSRGGGGMVIMLPPQVRSFTSDDGTFALENVPPGPVNLVVMAPGYTTGRVSNLTVEDGKDVANVEVQLDTGVRVTGRVTGPDGAPLSATNVRVDSAVGGMRGMRIPGSNDPATFTDASGEFVMEAVEPGEKTFAFNHTGLLPEERTVTLSGREARVDVQLSAGMRVTGQVLTEGGVPVSEALVRAMSAASSMMGKTTQTDGNGMFTLEGMTPGRYMFSASKNGYADGTLRDFDVSAGAPPRIIMKTGGTIFGHVSGLSESELQHASVQARSMNGSADAPVDASGNYRIEGAPVGTVRVSADVAQGFSQGRSSGMKSVQIEPGGSIQVDLEFKSETVVRGRVTRANAPLGNAMVMFTPRQSSTTTTSRVTTDDAGNYSVTGLDDASYNVSVIDTQRLSPYSTTYNVKGSGTLDIDIKATTVRGRVVDAGTGEPLVDARIDLRRADADSGSPFFGVRNALTVDGGTFLIDSVVPGAYHASASKEGYGNSTVEIVVGDAPGQDLDFRISRNPGITLRVVDGRNGQLLNATVRGTSSAGVPIPDTFKFGGVPEVVKLAVSAGTYNLTISAPGYATQFVTVISPSEQTIRLTPGGTVVVKSSSKSPGEQARLMDSAGHIVPTRGRFETFALDPSPGSTTLENVAPGRYVVQVVEGTRVLREATVVVVEGGSVEVGV